jgi:UDP-2,4-diacetamido-2,4,6-trideoxy-beta-L-altropyranose hydrolase
MRADDSAALLIRADAGVAMGTGHAMRCLALAQAWQDNGGRAVFAMAECTPAIQARLTAESCEILTISSPAGSTEDATQTVAFARERRAEWIVVDGYQFDAEFQRALKAAGFKVLFVDDYGHASHYSADMILNQNISADYALYSDREPYTQLFLGPRYCLLRREFSSWRGWKREIAHVGRKVLVTMGGSDPEKLTARVVDALASMKVGSLEVTVVVGGSAPYSELERPAVLPGNTIRVLRDISNIAEWMAWADVAISSAGTTCWELCLLALPALLVDVAKNQTALAQELDRRGCAIHLFAPHDFNGEKLKDRLQTLLQSVETRRAMSYRCRELVDGRGALRLTSAMNAGLCLRTAQPNDSRILWEWANDPQVRNNAFSTAPISWAQHEVWFADKMRDPDCRILIAEDDRGRPVGQFRVDWRPGSEGEQEGEIDVSLAADRRGTGYGSKLIDLAVNRIFAEKGQRLHAFVKLENQSSRRAFEQAGFTNVGEECVHGQQAIHYVRAAKP